MDIAPYKIEAAFEDIRIIHREAYCEKIGAATDRIKNLIKAQAAEIERLKERNELLDKNLTGALKANAGHQGKLAALQQDKARLVALLDNLESAIMRDERSVGLLPDVAAQIIRDYHAGTPKIDLTQECYPWRTNEEDY